jgi:hypothetical protein
MKRPTKWKRRPEPKQRREMDEAVRRYRGLVTRLPPGQASAPYKRPRRQLDEPFRDGLHPDYDERSEPEFEPYDEVMEPREADPEILIALDANIRNALTDKQRFVLKKKYSPQEVIEGADVMKHFSFRGERMKPGRWLAFDEVLNISPANRRALEEGGYLKIHRQGRRAPGDAAFERMVRAAALDDRSHARKIEQSAIRELRKRLFRMKPVKKS